MPPPPSQIDRFLERKLVIRQKLQLVGVTAMLLASKYEEIYAPEVRDFVYITDKAYTREQILAMEAQMLNTLDFKVRACGWCRRPRLGPRLAHACARLAVPRQHHMPGRAPPAPHARPCPANTTRHTPAPLPVRPTRARCR